MSERVPYVNHGHRHLPGGTDPIPASSRFTYILFGPADPVTANASAGDVECEDFSIPSDLDGMAIVKVEGFVTTPSSSGDISVDVYQYFPDRGGSGSSIFIGSDTLIINQGDYTSTPATQPVYSGVGFETDWYVVMQVVDPGTDTTGLGIHFTFGPATA